MRKGLALVCVLLVLAILSALHQQKPCHHQEGPAHIPAEAALPANQPKPEQQTAQCQSEVQRVYVLIRWPDGITAVAVILTLGAIVWQSDETRRAATASENAISLQFRPRLIVRRVFLRAGTMVKVADVPDNSWRVEYTIANLGGSPARIVERRFGTDSFPDQNIPVNLWDKPKADHSRVDIAPGEEMEFWVGLDESMATHFRLAGAIKGNYLESQPRTANFFFFGVAYYTDRVGITRKTAVLRHYDLVHGWFLSVDNPNYEYSD